MKIASKYKEFVVNRDEDIELTFTVPKAYYNEVLELESSNNDRLLLLDINVKHNQRTLEQNRLSWSLLRQIDKSINGLSTQETLDELYMNVLRMANINPHYMRIPDEAVNILKQSYRVVEVRKTGLVGNDGQEYKDCYMYKGISNFDKQEMSDFIQVILDYGSKQGIQMTYYNESLRGLIEQ